jgi:MraZ protein
MLLGRYYSQVSQKGRVALPAKFRSQIGGEIVIARWYETCLVIVGLAGWKALLQRFAREDEVITKPIRTVERFIFSTAYEIQTDEQGRFIIPGMLREIAAINDEVVFLGLGERIELWSKSIWEAEEVKVKKSADEMLEKIAKIRK